MNVANDLAVTTDPALGPAAATTLDDLASHVSLSDKAKGLLIDCATTDQFLAQLVSNGAAGEAVRILAHLLPIRHGVWWALLCAWEATGGNPSLEEDSALGAVARWVVVPSEGARRTVEESIRLLPHPSAGHACVRASCLAGAADGPNMPLVPIQLKNATRQVVAAVLHSVTEIERKRRGTCLEQLLDVGLDIREGKLDWQAMLTDVVDRPAQTEGA